MLSDRKVRMLQLLDKHVNSCRKCQLCHNGTAIPFWTENSKYAIIGESPNKKEIIKQTPFVGGSSEILTNFLLELKFNPSDFLIINSVQCRPIMENKDWRNGKPTIPQLEKCKDYIRKYLKIIDPEKILCLGNFAKYMFDGKTSGVLGQRGQFRDYLLDGGKEYPVLFTVNPAFCLFEESGKDMLRNDLILFRDTKFEKKDDWFFTEDEFRI